MARISYSPDEAQKFMTALDETAAFLIGIAGGYDESACRWSPSPRDWSLIEVLAHLRACAELWTYSIYAMLAEEQPTLPLLDERRWAKTRRTTDATFAANVQGFALERSALLNALRGLTAEQWQRTCVIEDRTHSVFGQTRRMALHEIEHQAQMQALLDGLASHPQQ